MPERLASMAVFGCVADKCGFASVDTLRRTFAKHVGVTPAAYRKCHRVPEN